MQKFVKKNEMQLWKNKSSTIYNNNELNKAKEELLMISFVVVSRTCFSGSFFIFKSECMCRSKP